MSEWTKTGDAPVFTEEPGPVPPKSWDPGKSAGKAGVAVLTTWITGALTITGAIMADPQASALILPLVTRLVADHKEWGLVFALLQAGVVFYRDKRKHTPKKIDDPLAFPGGPSEL